MVVAEVMEVATVLLALLQQEQKLIGVGIAAGTAVIGPGAGMGYLIGQTIASIHRQPEAFEQTRTLMFLGIGLVEAFALYGIVFALLIAFVLQERATFSPLRRRFRDPVVLPGQKLHERVMPVLVYGCRFSSKIQDWRKLWRIEPAARTRRVR